jgi:hypothetical protein
MVLRDRNSKMGHDRQLFLTSETTILVSSAVGTCPRSANGFERTDCRNWGFPRNGGFQQKNIDPLSTYRLVHRTNLFKYAKVLLVRYTISK